MRIGNREPALPQPEEIRQIFRETVVQEALAAVKPIYDAFETQKPHEGDFSIKEFLPTIDAATDQFISFRDLVQNTTSHTNMWAMKEDIRFFLAKERKPGEIPSFQIFNKNKLFELRDHIKESHQQIPVTAVKNALQGAQSFEKIMDKFNNLGSGLFALSPNAYPRTFQEFTQQARARFNSKDEYR